MTWAWWTRALMATMVALVLATPASAAPGDGRLGGDPTAAKANTLCPAGVGATGVAGNLGEVGVNPVVATLTMRCRGGVAAVGAIGSFSGPRGSGATGCGAGQVAVGIVGREGSLIDQIAVRCQASDLTGAKSSATGYGG